MEEVSVAGSTPRSEAGPARPRGLRSAPRADLVVLAVLIASYTAIVAELSMLRYGNFFTSNWDLGINQQMLWSTGHGRLLYEAGDYVSYGSVSYLEVHPTFIALAVAPLYLALPTPLTLFVLQGAVAAAAIVPLYLIAVEVLRSRVLTFGLIGLYLVAFPVTSGLMFDFHWEAFLPLEFLLLWYCYTQRRYAAALVVLVVGCCTLEVFAFLAVMVPVAVLVTRERLLPATRVLELPRELLRLARRMWTLRDGRVAVAFLGGSVALYVGLRAVQWFAIPFLLGNAASVSTAQGAGSGLAGFATFPFSKATLLLSGGYWVLFLAAVAFLPVVHPRYLILLLPWFVYATFADPFFSSGFGYQYPLVIIGPLLVASTHGLGRLQTWWRAAPGASVVPVVLLLGAVAAVGVLSVVPGSSVFLQGTPGSARAAYRYFLPALAVFALGAWWLRHQARAAAPAAAPCEDPHRGSPARGLTGRRLRAGGLAVFALLVAFNLFMSPMNTANSTTVPGYRFAYSTSPVASHMGALTSLIPGNAVVLASDFLFPYVANDVHAVSLPWFEDFSSREPYFPFGPTNLPPYVLIDSAEYFIVPPFLQVLLSNSSTYGLLGSISCSSYPGSVTLYELGYTGPAIEVNATPALTPFERTAGAVDAPSGAVAQPGNALRANPHDALGRGEPDLSPGTPAGSQATSLRLMVEHSVVRAQPARP